MYLFAQLRQLPALAPFIPTKEPRLRQTAYEMVLHAFLLSPADHPRLLDALQRWPPDLYSVPSLTQSVVQRSSPAILLPVLHGSPWDHSICAHCCITLPLIAWVHLAADALPKAHVL